MIISVLTSIIICLFEISVFISLCDSFFLRRSVKKYFPVLLALGEYIGFIGMSYFVSGNFSKVAGALLLFILVSCIGFRGQLLYKILVSMIYWIFLNAAEYISVFLVSRIYRIDLLKTDLTMPVVIVSKLFVFLAFMIVKKKLSFRSMPLYNFDWFILCLYPVYSIVLILIQYNDYRNIHFVSNTALFVSLFSLASNIIVLIFLEILFDKRKYELDNQALTLQIRNTEDKMRTLQESQTQLRKQAHDFQNHLNTIKELLKADNPEPAKEYIEKLSTTLVSGHKRVNTGNLYIDTILNHKYNEANSKGINITFDINDFSHFSTIEPHDMVSLLSNTIDNAIEACMLCDGPKMIEIQIRNDNSQMLYSISNSVPAPVVIDLHEPQRSTKADPSGHGYGLKIIEETVEKYHGQMNYSYCGGKVIFICIINM